MSSFCLNTCKTRAPLTPCCIDYNLINSSQACIICWRSSLKRLPASSSLRLIAETAYWRARQSVCLTGCSQSWTLQQSWSVIVESMTMWRHCSVIATLASGVSSWCCAGLPKIILRWGVSIESGSTSAIWGEGRPYSPKIEALFRRSRLFYCRTTELE